MEKKSVPSTLIDLSLSENQEDIQLQMILNGSILNNSVQRLKNYDLYKV